MSKSKTMPVAQTPEPEITRQGDAPNVNGANPELCGERHDRVIAAWLRHSGAEAFDCRTSLPVTEAWHRTAILSILDSDCVPGGSLIGQVFELGHYIVHPVELRDDESGEVTQAARIVLPQSDGPPIAFVSDGVIKSIAKIAWAIGREPPYDPPVKVRLKQLSSRGGRRYFKLVPAE